MNEEVPEKTEEGRIQLEEHARSTGPVDPPATIP